MHGALAGRVFEMRQACFAAPSAPCAFAIYTGWTGTVVFMNRCENAVLRAGKPTSFARRMATVLSGATMLAGVPSFALAQDNAESGAAPAGAAPQTTPQSAPAPAPAPAPASDIIPSISVSGAERLEPTTIWSYIRLRVGQE